MSKYFLNLIKLNIIIFGLFFINYSLVQAESLNLPKDSNGWTIFTPSADSKIIYVDSVTGNDTTCKTYLPSAVEIGPNPFIPIGDILPCATASKAFSLSTGFVPDWVLFKRGSVFNERLYPDQIGRSVTEPRLISSYGSIDAMPIIRGGIETNGNLSAQYLAIAGLDFYRDANDPESPNYAPEITYSSGMFFFSHSAYNHKGILVEGCKIRFFQDNVNMAIGRVGTSGVVFRRNIVLNASSRTGGHSQGMLAGGIEGLVVEENVFDHNGWRMQNNNDEITEAGEATMFNHNMYLSGNNNSIVRDNIVIRGSSNNIKLRPSDNMQVTDNLIVGGEIAISAGSPDEHEIYSFVNPQITENVWLYPGKWNPTNRELAWFFYNFSWDGGLVQNNFMLHQTDDSLG